MKINPNGFREYDARWLYEKDIDLEGITDLGKGLGTQIIMGQNPARQTAINSGIPFTKPAYTVNQVCGSGLRAVVAAYQSIKLGENKIIVAGGQENMSKAPHALFYREDKKILENKLIDTMIHDGLLDAFNNYHMGVTAENIAEKFKISRDKQDKFALRSQNKTQLALDQNKFKDELVVVDINGNYLDSDEHPRKNLKIEDIPVEIEID